MNACEANDNKILRKVFNYDRDDKYDFYITMKRTYITIFYSRLYILIYNIKNTFIIFDHDKNFVKNHLLYRAQNDQIFY